MESRIIKKAKKGISISLAMVFMITVFSFTTSCGNNCKHEEIIIDEAKEPTCDQTGLTEGSHCAICGKIINEQEVISELGHDLIEIDGKDATCEEDGITTAYKCLRCGEVVLGGKIIPHAGHDIVVDKAVEPDDDHTGLTEGSHCSKCGKIFKEQKVTKKAKVNLSRSTAMSVDNNTVGSIERSGISFLSGNCKRSTSSIVTLNHNGTFANVTALKKISSLKITVSGDYSNLYFYSGDAALPVTKEVKFTSEELSLTNLNDKFFIISYQGSSTVNINTVDLDSTFVENGDDFEELPVVEINTDYDQNMERRKITSRTEYLGTEISIFSKDESIPDVYRQRGQIRIRGNSTAEEEKKPYRIKFDKKQSVMGLTKAKNWCLLAEYYDPSTMHNFLAHKIVGMFGNSKFLLHPIHVKVIINGNDMGLYTLIENPDEDEGRANIKQDITYTTKVEDINFLIEYDGRAMQNGEVEDVTFVRVKGKSSREPYGIKYPEPTDFPDYDESANVSPMYRDFIQYLKTYLEDAWDAIIKKDLTKIWEKFDKNSMYNQAMLDLIADERDHSWLSFKIYKDKTNKLICGPCWDYDITAWGFSWTGSYYTDPFKQHHSFNDYPSNEWPKVITTQIEESKNEFNKIFKDFYSKNQSKMLELITNEYVLISKELLNNTKLWYKNNISITFENIRYFNWYLNDRYNTLMNGILKNA